ncbi:DUF5134 domain-containing protein [Saccharopolyspora erythraea]|nr:DUF5134 domain-containing protein [Saccharopolyspora erythraea]
MTTSATRLPSYPRTGGAMGGPAWLRWCLLAVIGTFTLLALVRQVSGLWRVEGGRAMAVDFPVAFTHVLMGVGLCALLLPGPGAAMAVWWQALFLAGAVWTCVLAYRGLGGVALYAHLLVIDLAMFYLFAAVRAPDAGPAPQVRPVEPTAPAHPHDAPLFDIRVIDGGGTVIALPLVALVLAAYFVLRAGYSATDLVTGRDEESADPASVPPPFSARLDHATALVMQLGLAYMFFTLL